MQPSIPRRELELVKAVRDQSLIREYKAKYGIKTREEGQNSSLSALFEEVSKIADLVTDSQLKTQLKVIAAVGQEKLKAPKN